jgi:DHA1 family bicyclomycin/chloramphenicol resistance-like MFS transporter
MRIQPTSFAIMMLEPFPQIAGAIGAAAGSVQMTSGSVSSALVAVLYDGSSAFSMTTVVMLCSVATLVSYLLAVRPAKHRVAGFSQVQPGRNVTSVE